MAHKYLQFVTLEIVNSTRDTEAETIMTQHNLTNELTPHFHIDEPIFINSTRNIQRKGKIDEWSYIAWYQKDDAGNVTVECSAGSPLADNQFRFSIPVHKIFKKKK